MYKLQNISYSIGDFKLKVDSLHLKQGAVYAVLGPNGCGKTTLLNLLMFLVKPKNGKIFFKASKVSHLPENSLIDIRRQIGYLMQRPYLFDSTVYENIACGLKFRNLPMQVIKEKVKEIINVFSLGRIANKKVSELSGGEKQKTALARTLAADSEVLILDEPMTNLDKKSVTKLENLLLDLNKKKGKTIIFSTHIQHHAHELTKNIIAMNEGKIL